VDSIFEWAVVGSVTAVANLRFGVSHEIVNTLVASVFMSHGRDCWGRLKFFREPLSLIDVENRIRLEKRDHLFFFLAVVIAFRSGERARKDDRRGFFARANVSALVLGLLICEPVSASVSLPMCG